MLGNEVGNVLNEETYQYNKMNSQENIKIFKK